MSDNFNFTGGGKILFGAGKFSLLASQTNLKQSVLICGRSFTGSEQYQSIKNSVYKQFIISGEPEPDSIDRITDSVKGKINSVIAVGGGSVLDAGKAVAAMCLSEGSVEDYLEGVGTKTPGGETLPLIAIPTTAGTGSEATKNAVLCRRGNDGYKKSLRHDNYIPRTVIIDPELYISCPGEIMSSCGMDAFCQLIESYFSTGASPYTDILSWKGMTIFIDSFAGLISKKNKDLRTMGEIAFAAYLSGVTLANAGLGTVHGIAGPMGGFFDIPHGTACGTLLPEIMRRTIEGLLSGENGKILDKARQIGSYIIEHTNIENNGEPAFALCSLLEKWLIDFDIPRLSEFGITISDADKIACASGNKNNPVQFTTEEIKEIILSRI